MNNRTLILQFKIVAGSTEVQSAQDLAEAAERFGVAVEADFNGFPMTAWPGDDTAKVLRMFRDIRRALKRTKLTKKPSAQ